MRPLPLLLFAWFATPAAHAVIYDATADFIANSPNPNGVWTYGYTTTLGGSLLNFDQYLDTGTFLVWRHEISSGAPGFAKNVGGSSSFGVAPGQIELHPGPNGEYGVLRFTAPASALYSYTAQFFAGDGGQTDATILLNSNSAGPLYYNSDTGTNPATTNSLALTTGSTVDFVVGYAGSFISDSTPLSVQISAVPEPAESVLALGLAAAMVAWAARRKR